MKRSLLLIEDDNLAFEKIKSALQDSYEIIPEKNFKRELFKDTDKLKEKIKEILNEQWESKNIVGVILDANLKDSLGVTDDKSGVKVILPFIRNELDYPLSVIPVVVLTKYSELQTNAFENLANIFVEKPKILGLESTLKAEVTLILNSLTQLFEYHLIFAGKRYSKDLSEQILFRLNEIMKTLREFYKNSLAKQSIILFILLESLEPAKRKDLIDNAIDKLNKKGINDQELINLLNQIKYDADFQKTIQIIEDVKGKVSDVVFGQILSIIFNLILQNFGLNT